MQFFLDTGDITEIKRALNLGLLDGVTTNPSLVAQTGKSFKELILDICSVCKGPVSAEVISNTYDAMLKEAFEVAAWAPNVVVKLPLTEDGLRVTGRCSEKGIKTNVTLCFSATAALLAAKAGATYISPFVGRLDDIGAFGMELIEEIKQIYQNYDYKTKILVASIRSPLHVKDAALAGAHVVTVPSKILHQLYKHPLTDSGLEKFLLDAKKFS